MNKKYDVLVIGGGLAGYYSSKNLARGGKKVALIEKEKLGGTSLIWGALPVKRALDSFKNGKRDIFKTWNEDLSILEEKIRKDLEKNKIDIYYGGGEFLDSRTFIINNITLEGDYIIIATGTNSSTIEGIPIDGEKIITHKDAIDLRPLHEDIIILGGNVEGVEFAALFGEMGKNVVLIEKEEKILLGNDRDLVEPIEKHLLEKNVQIIKGIGAWNAWVDGNRVKVRLEDGSIIDGDNVLTTVLREPNFPKGIEKLNINIDRDKIPVDKNLRTNEDNIFAIGDINGIMSMGHVAIHQGIQVAEYITNRNPVNMNYELLPRAVFTLPEMAGVGKQEWELEGLPYRVGYCEFKNTWRGWAKDIENGFVKLIIDDRDTVLGIWMVGENVSEYIGLLSVLMKNRLTVKDIKNNLIIHPTLTEALLEAIS